MGLQPQAGGSRCRCPGMIGLDAAGGNQHVGPFLQGFRDGKLQLSDFVPGHFHAGKVIPFDPDLSAQFIGNAIQRIYRGGKIGKPDPLNAVKLFFKNRIPHD